MTLIRVFVTWVLRHCPISSSVSCLASWSRTSCSTNCAASVDSCLSIADLALLNCFRAFANLESFMCSNLALFWEWTGFSQDCFAISWNPKPPCLEAETIVLPMEGAQENTMGQGSDTDDPIRMHG
jgi:hypothetical protein